MRHAIESCPSSLPDCQRLTNGYLLMSHGRFSMEVIHGRFGSTKKASDAPQFDMISLSWSNSSTAFRNLAWTGSHEMVHMIGSYDMIHMGHLQMRKLYKELNFQEVVFLFAHCAAPVLQENWHT